MAAAQFDLLQIHRSGLHRDVPIENNVGPEVDPGTCLRKAPYASVSAYLRDVMNVSAVHDVL